VAGPADKARLTVFLAGASGNRTQPERCRSTGGFEGRGAHQGRVHSQIIYGSTPGSWAASACGGGMESCSVMGGFGAASGASVRAVFC